MFTLKCGRATLNDDIYIGAPYLGVFLVSNDEVLRRDRMSCNFDVIVFSGNVTITSRISTVAAISRLRSAACRNYDTKAWKLFTTKNGYRVALSINTDLRRVGRL